MRMRKGLLVPALGVTIVASYVWILSIDVDPPDESRLLVVDAPPDDGEPPAGDNGYAILLRAIEAMSWPEDDAWIYEMPAGDMAEDAAIQALLASNAEALALLRGASAAPAFEVPPSSDPGESTHLAEAQRLGKLVAIEATLLAVRGDDDSFAPLLQFLTLVHRFKSTGEMIHYLIGSALEATTLQNMLLVAAESEGEGIASLPEQLGELAWDRESMANALRREYAFMVAQVDEPFQRAGGWNDVPLLGRYVYQRNRTRALYAASFTTAIEGLDEDCATAPSGSSEPAFAWWRYFGPNSAGRILHGISVSSLARFSFSRCGEQFTLGLTRVALAARAYRADRGALPESLDALVPRYLTDLPTDVDGRPFRYSADEAYVYSVGHDRQDGGGGEPSFRVHWSAPDPTVSLRR